MEINIDDIMMMMTMKQNDRNHPSRGKHKSSDRPSCCCCRETKVRDRRVIVYECVRVRVWGELARERENDGWHIMYMKWASHMSFINFCTLFLCGRITLNCRYEER